MAKLLLTTNQKTLIIEALTQALEDAWADGVETTGSVPYFDEMRFYNERLTAGDKTDVRDSMRVILATLVKVMNFDKPGLGTAAAPAIVPLAQLTGFGGQGSLTIVGGLIVAKVDPT